MHDFLCHDGKFAGLFSLSADCAETGEAVGVWNIGKLERGNEFLSLIMVVFWTKHRDCLSIFRLKHVELS